MKKRKTTKKIVPSSLGLEHYRAMILKALKHKDSFVTGVTVNNEVCGSFELVLSRQTFIVKITNHYGI